MQEGLLFTLPGHAYEQLFKNIRKSSQHGTRIIKTFYLCSVDSDTIRNRETLPEEEMQNVGIFVFERKKLCATACKFEGGWNAHHYRILIFLLNKIEDKVSRVDTNYRDSIPVSVLLALTLRFLATGD